MAAIVLSLWCCSAVLTQLHHLCRYGKLSKKVDCTLLIAAWCESGCSSLPLVQ